MLTKVDILNEAFGPDGSYSTDPYKRGLDGSRCLYLVPTDDDSARCCSVGRWLLPEWADRVDYDLVSADDSDVRALERFVRRTHSLTLDDILEAEVRGHSTDFWDDVQDLHDKPGFWTEIGLSKQGALQFQTLLRRYHEA